MKSIKQHVTKRRLYFENNLVRCFCYVIIKYSVNKEKVNVLTHAMPVNHFNTINSVSEMFVKAGHVTLVGIDFRAHVVYL